MKRLSNIILSFSLIIMLCTEATAQKKTMFLIGAGFPETLNAGFRYRFREQSEYMMSIGSWPSTADSWFFDWKSLVSVSCDYSYHLGGETKYSDMKPWYLKAGINYMRIKFDSDTENNLMAHFLLARDLYFVDGFGMSLDAGFAIPFINETGFRSLLPAFGMSFFFRL